MSLQTGTELVSLAFLFNNITGVYGILAILTGYAPSALQLSMYVYSVLSVGAIAFLGPHIRRQTPFHNLALAWLYLLDTAVNAAYTTSFAVAWYLAGFHNPNGTASADSFPITPSASAARAFFLIASPGGSAMADKTRAIPGSGAAAAEAQVRETAVSMVVIAALMLVRVYSAVVVAAHARMVLLRSAEGQPARARADNDGAARDKAGQPGKARKAPSPFAEGDGWQDRLGRLMVSVGEGYWLGAKEDEEWTRDVSSKFKSGRARAAKGTTA